MIGSFSNSFGLEMGMVVSLRDHFSPVAEGIRRQFSRLMGDASLLEQTLSSSFKKIVSSAAGLTIGLAAMIPFINSIKIAADVGVVKETFDVMLGGFKESRMMVSELKDFALRNPQFDFESALGYTKTFLGAGVKKEQVLNDLRMIGDVAAVVGFDKLDQLAYAYREVMGRDRAMAQELNVQIGSTGFPIKEYLARLEGVSVSEFSKRFNSGASDQIIVTGEKFRQAFALATSEGERFGNMMQKTAFLAKSQWLMIKDIIWLTSLNIGDSLIGSVSLLSSAFVVLLNAVKDFTETGFGRFLVNVIFWTGSIITLYYGWRLVVGLLSFAYKSSSLVITEFFSKILTRINRVIARTWDLIWLNLQYKSIFGTITELTQIGLTKMINGIGFLLKKFLVFTAILGAIKALMMIFGVDNGFFKNMPLLFETLTKSMATMNKNGIYTIEAERAKELDKLGLTSTFNWLINKLYFIKEFFVSMYEGFVEGFDEITSFFTRFLSGSGGDMWSDISAARQNGQQIGKMLGYAVGIMTDVFIMLYVMLTDIMNMFTLEDDLENIGKQWTSFTDKISDGQWGRILDGEDIYVSKERQRKIDNQKMWDDAYVAPRPEPTPQKSPVEPYRRYIDRGRASSFAGGGNLIVNLQVDNDTLATKVIDWNTFKSNLK